MVNGTRVYDYDLELEKIAYNHTLSNYAFRAGGSSGANATADWILEQFQSFGLEAYKEPFQFTNWDVLSQPTLVIDDDGNSDTIDDQNSFNSFQSEHYSWPTTQAGAFADLVVLPLPPAASHDELGLYPINLTAWNAINTTGKILLIGREIRMVSSWEQAYKDKLTAQTPAAVVYTWWYEWMSFIPDFFSSIGGRPTGGWGPYYWNLGIPVGWVNYVDGLWIRNRESSLNVSARVQIEAVIGSGPHYNVIGKLTGYKYPNKFVIVSSHYDTVMCSGFCDNGAGTAAVIELAKIFAEANQTGLLRPKYTILFMSFASEELGLVGSINYVMQHEAEMSDIIAVINLDCIGSDNFCYTETNPGNYFDLDELVLKSAQDIGIPAQTDVGGGDEASFRDPAVANALYQNVWGLNAGIADATPVNSTIFLGSLPMLYREKWTTGEIGWIHTSYDNSTSTETLNWVESDDLENQVKVTALSTTRIVTPNQFDVNNDGIVNMRDIGEFCAAFGSTSADPDWNPAYDVTGSTPLLPDGRVDMRDIGEICRHFGETDL
jgi:hypothetical protein